MNNFDAIRTNAKKIDAGYRIITWATLAIGSAILICGRNVREERAIAARERWTNRREDVAVGGPSKTSVATWKWILPRSRRPPLFKDEVYKPRLYSFPSCLRTARLSVSLQHVTSAGGKRRECKDTFHAIPSSAVITGAKGPGT